MTEMQNTEPDYNDKLYREDAASVLYLGNGIFVATKTVLGFGASAEDALRNLENGLSLRDFRISNRS